MDTTRSSEPPMWSVRHVGETGSTNDDLAALDAEHAPHGTVLWADHQTAGRGRFDRRWEAPPGANLLLSIAIREGIDPADPHDATRRVAVAMAEAASELSGRDIGLKWPNDLVLDDRKVAGILAQLGTDRSVVVGVGVNVGWAPAGAERLAGVDREPLLDRFLGRLSARWGTDIGDAYRTRLTTLGRRVRVELAGEAFAGDAVDLAPSGALIVAVAPGVTREVAAGDVVHVRPATT